MQNPLLANEEFARYDLIKAEHFVPATEEIIKLSKEKFRKIVEIKGQRTFDNTVLPMLEMEEALSKVVTPMSQLFSLMATPEVMAEFEKAQKLLTSFYNELSMDKDNYRIFKEFAATEEAKAFTGERKKYMEDTMKGFKLSGAELSDEDKKKLKALNMELSNLSIQFSNNVIKSVFNLVIKDKKDLAGLSEDIIRGAHAKAKMLKLDEGKEDIWVFNLDYPSMLPFMKYSENDELRKLLWTKNMTKAIDEDKDNRPVIQKILELKKKKANLLGFKTYAELSLETKMANSPQEVMDFLDDIAVKAADIAKGEMQELIDLKNSVTGESCTTIMPWELAYWSNKLKEKKYSYNEDEVREYFEVNNALKGMFNIFNKLYGIKFEKVEGIAVWHESVSLYKIIDESDELRAYVFIDLYPRTGLKRPGAWMNSIVGAKNDKNGKVIAQVGVHCNFSEPIGDKPALLTYDELQTLYHEFGHALHGALSKTELSATGGTSVCWDVVELPSTFHENFVRTKESLKTFTKHYKTGEQMPEELMDKLLKSNDFLRASGAMRQITFGMFDMSLYHTEALKDETPDAHEVYKQIHAKYSLTPFIEGTYFETAFSHIFAGGYSAGYYSYMWANILDADAFSKLEEGGKILDREVGRSFMENILEMGSSEDMNILFERFRGRAVSNKPLLKRLGL